MIIFALLLQAGYYIAIVDRMNANTTCVNNFDR